MPEILGPAHGTMPAPPLHLVDPVDVDGLVAWLRSRSFDPGEAEATSDLRHQLSAVVRRGGCAAEDAGAVLGGELLRHPRLYSPRRLLGPLIVWCKRHVAWRIIRFHIEFTEENARRQDGFNQSLLALIEHLAARIVRLEQELDAVRQRDGLADDPFRERTR